MTNIERIRKMGAEDLIKTMDSILHCKFRKYVDLTAFMNGESEDVSDYLKVKYYGLFRPCEAKVQAFKNEAKLACKNFDFDERKYIEDHSRLLPVVDEYSLQGYDFCVVIESNQIADIDSSNLRVKYGKEKPNLNKADTANESGLCFNISVKNGVVINIEPDRKDDIS